MTKSVLLSIVIFLMISCQENKNVLEEKSAPVAITETAPVEETKKEYSIGNIQIQLNQYKGDGTDFYCKSELITYKDGRQLDYLSFTPEPVGGDYGISHATKFESHVVFTKHGDYDGRTIIINEEGRIFNVVGGENYMDEEAQLLFTIYESDLSGLTVFDFKTDSVLLTMEDIDVRPMTFYKDFGNRYFTACVNDETSEQSIWEIELDLQRIMQVELNNSDFNAANQLKKVAQSDAECLCRH